MPLNCAIHQTPCHAQPSPFMCIVQFLFITVVQPETTSYSESVGSIHARGARTKPSGNRSNVLQVLTVRRDTGPAHSHSKVNGASANGSCFNLLQ
jgi:hypothetical protein